MIYRLLIFCTILGGVYASQFPLLERLETAQNGDFVVFESNKTITLLAIRSTNNHSVLLEEITAPSPKNRPASWAEWLQRNAPGHTSWSMVEVDLQEKEIVEAYSFSRASWFSGGPNDSFLATLLRLPLTPLPKEQWRRIGPAPLEGETDLRKVWTPPLVVEGKQIATGLFDAYETTWPEDNSELAGKGVQLYFDREKIIPLPCWMQIDTGHITASLRVIDSGHKLPPSPYRAIPRRIPAFIGAPVKTGGGNLRFTIKSPKYYKSFELFAVDITAQEKEIHLLEHSITQSGNELVHLDITADEIHHQLKPNHKYTWLLIPSTHSGSYSEFTKPYTWVP